MRYMSMQEVYKKENKEFLFKTFKRLHEIEPKVVRTNAKGQETNFGKNIKIIPTQHKKEYDYLWGRLYPYLQSFTLSLLCKEEKKWKQPRWSLAFGDPDIVDVIIVEAFEKGLTKKFNEDKCINIFNYIKACIFSAYVNVMQKDLKKGARRNNGSVVNSVGWAREFNYKMQSLDEISFSEEAQPTIEHPDFVSFDATFDEILSAAYELDGVDENFLNNVFLPTLSLIAEDAKKTYTPVLIHAPEWEYRSMYDVWSEHTGVSNNKYKIMFHLVHLKLKKEISELIKTGVL